MNILIKDDNAGRINDAILKAEGRGVTTRTLIYADAASAAKRADEHPAISLLTKKDRIGVRVVYQEAHKLPSSYKYRANATAITIEYKKSGWALVDVRRLPNIQSESNELRVQMTQEIASRAISQLAKTFTVKS